RQKRREERVESAAAEISGFFGVKGDLLRGQLEDSWSERDWSWVRNRAGYLASMAEHCYEIAERAPDELQILIGVVWLEAQEVSDLAEQLDGVPGDKWESHEIFRHLQSVRNYYPQVEDRLFWLLGPDR
ncbi:MAG: hypothetical protein LC808_44220, partial [Actinobacteria bacterium]|nr:hypothetical protein [Actinomycetota bacterium]